MVFSSPLFIFLFLPVVLAGYFLLPGIRARNYWLLGVSIVFYAWGEADFVFLLLVSTLINYGLGRGLDQSQDPGRRKALLTLAVVEGRLAQNDREGAKRLLKQGSGETATRG